MRTERYNLLCAICGKLYDTLYCGERSCYLSEFNVLKKESDVVRRRAIVVEQMAPVKRCKAKKTGKFTKAQFKFYFIARTNHRNGDFI